MEKPIIEVKNLSKKYILAHRLPYETLRDTVTELVKKPFHLLKGYKKTKKEEFWALKDINFTVQKGEAIGLIGPNGSGKSTLLKLLSQITSPTTGEIILRGKVASLLEVGTGFHSELTGRENIYLNGAVLGMKKKEIASKFDEIVKFSGVRKFLDTPVKRYSSGMHVRLAFSVAAHLEPEILLVDEVLAVGDAEFQNKCLGKMDEVTKEAGRTIIFVSHNMEAIKKLCRKCILLKDGKIAMFDATHKVVEQYLYKSNRSSSAALHDRKDRSGEGAVKFTDIQITNSLNSKIIKSGDRLKITMKYKSMFNERIEDVRVVVIINNDDLRRVLWLDSDVSAISFPKALPPQGTIVCETKEAHLIEGRYFVEINFHIKGVSQDLLVIAAEFDVTTDLDKYHFKNKPDNSVCNYVIEYSYKQY